MLYSHARRSGERSGNRRQNRDDDVDNRFDKSLVHVLGRLVVLSFSRLVVLEERGVRREVSWQTE